MIQKVILLSFLTFMSTRIFSQVCNTPPASLDCENAPILCTISDLDGYCTTLPDFPNPTGPNPICSNGGVPNNTIWFGFIAATTNYSFNIIPANCTNLDGFQGIQGGIFSGDCGNPTPIVCQGQCTTEIINLNANTYVPGEVYWFIIDGCNGSVCDITIDLLAGGNISKIDEIDSIQAPAKACAGDMLTINTKPVKGATDYVWTINDVITFTPEKNGNSINLKFDQPGTFNVCLDVSNACIPVDSLPLKKCTEIVISEAIPPIDIEETICFNEAFEFKGGTYPVGKHTVIVPSQTSPCDTIFNLTISEKPKIETNLGVIFQKCADDCISIMDSLGNGGVFCEETDGPTYVNLTAKDGCDSVVIYQLARYKQFIDTLICFGDSLLIGNDYVKSPGTYYRDELKKADTCVLEVIKVDYANMFSNNIKICPGDSVLIAGNYYSKKGNYVIPVKTNTSCDSLLFLNIDYLPAHKKQLFVDIKKGENYGGVQINKDTIVVFNLKNQFGCDSIVTVNFSIITSTSSSNQSNLKINLFPNPVKSTMTLQANEAVKIYELEIYNVLGQKVLTQHPETELPFTLNIENLPLGIYWINVKTKDEWVVCRFMKISGS